MAEDFVTFRKLHDTEIGRQFVTALEHHNIDAKVDNVPPLFDPNNNEEDMASELTIKLHRADFSKAAQLLKEIISQLLKNIDKDYYLFALSDKELEQLVNRHHINEFDLLLAQQILKERKSISSK